MSIIKPIAFEDISKEDFIAYEGVRASGETNMYSYLVQEWAHFSKEVHLGILTHYDELNKKWPDVRQNSEAAGPSLALPAYKSPLPDNPADDIYPPKF